MHYKGMDSGGTSIMTLLEIKDICHNFGGLVALDHVSFQVRAGQVKAVIGPNGAGKTTLFNIISGILPPRRGTILLEGRPISGRPPHQVARAGIGRTFQNVSLFLHMSVLENVMVGRHYRGRHDFLSALVRWPGQVREERALRARALECLEFIGLAARADQPVSALSFGQRRMVELARALAAEPRLLLLDEPASGLNTRESCDLAERIRQIRDRGVTVLLVEHNMSLVMDVADEIFVLHFGAPLAEGTADEIRNHPKVVAVYLGDDPAYAAHH